MTGLLSENPRRTGPFGPFGALQNLSGLRQSLRPKRAPVRPRRGSVGFLAPQTRPKKGTDRQDTEPGNRTTSTCTIAEPVRSINIVLRSRSTTLISNSGMPREPQEGISETREQVSGHRITDKDRPWLRDTVSGFPRDGGD